MRTFCSLCELAILCMQRIHVLIVIDLDFIYWFQTVVDLSLDTDEMGWIFGRIFTHPIRERLLFWWVTVFFEQNSDCLPQVPALVKKALNHLITYFHVMWQNECIINCFSNLHCMWHILSFFTNVDDPWSPLSQMLVIYTLTWACRCI